MKRVLEALGLRRRTGRTPNAALHTIRVPSTIDGTLHPSLFIPAASNSARPLLVYFHPWRHGYDTDSTRWREEARMRDWHFLAPHFRGPNKHPEACASRVARQDVLDAIDVVDRNHLIDRDRLYGAGVSGGGHMALVMAAERPALWAGISSWCAITDLFEFYRECVSAGAKAHRHIVKVAGGAPGSSARVDEELRYRSPRFHLARAADVPLDINHGVRDGRPKGVGIQHSVWAFNAVAEACGAPPVREAKLQLLRERNDLREDPEQDELYGRVIYLRRQAGRARLTIFEGGHEDLPTPACAWLERQLRSQSFQTQDPLDRSGSMVNR